MKNQPPLNANQEIVPPDLPALEDQEPFLLARYWKQVREKLCEFLEQDTALELTDKLRTLTQVLEILRIEEQVLEPKKGKRGGQQIDRRPLARAFVAKAFLNLSSTRALIEQLHQSVALRKLCGIDKVPSEATFSRAFAQFAQLNLGDLVHQSMIAKFVSSQIVMHASHDSTALEAREKAVKKVKVPKVKKNQVVPRKERFALRRSRLACNDRWIWSLRWLWQSYLGTAIGEPNATRMETCIVGVVTRRT